MNHLAHLYLAGDDDHLLLGGFLGDFIKGRQNGMRPQSIERGIALHRAIDGFTDRHQLITSVKTCMPDSMRRVSGIITDIVFDQCLAKRWSCHHTETLDTFDRTVFLRLLSSKNAPFFTDAALLVCTNMQTYRSLLRTLDPDYVARSLLNIAKRMKRGTEFFNPASLRDLEPTLPEVEQIFDEFFASLKDFVDNWTTTNPD